MAILGVQPDTPALTEEDRRNLDWAARCGVTDVLQPFVRGRRTWRCCEGPCGARPGAGAGDGEDREPAGHREAGRDHRCIRCDLYCPGRSGEQYAAVGAARRAEGHRRPVPDGGAVLLCGDPFAVVYGRRAVPTRAEVCDIYNAVLDGSDALMLTGETAAGRYPVQAMEYLVKTARSALSTGRAG